MHVMVVLNLNLVKQDDAESFMGFVDQMATNLNECDRLPEVFSVTRTTFNLILGYAASVQYSDSACSDCHTLLL